MQISLLCGNFPTGNVWGGLSFERNNDMLSNFQGEDDKCKANTLFDKILALLSDVKMVGKRNPLVTKEKNEFFPLFTTISYCVRLIIGFTTGLIGYVLRLLKFFTIDQTLYKKALIIKSFHWYF